MDSLSQAALGAAVGEAAAGRNAGRKAAAWGAALATLPDLDVFIPLANDVAEFTSHRSVTHSLPVMAVAAPVLVWLLGRLHPQVRADRRRWSVLVLACLWTHALLDAFTAYGTQLLWPLPVAPVAWSTIFIIDPAYTLPLLAGVIIAMARRGRLAHRCNTAGLCLSAAYLLWTAAAQDHVEDLGSGAAAAGGVEVERVMATPTPFNSLLWRILAMTPEGDYLEGYHSLADGDDRPPALRRHDGGRPLLEPLFHTWAVRRLQWFTDGYYAARLDGRRVVLVDLRMGLGPFYVFQFVVGEIRGGGQPAPVTAVRAAAPATSRGQFAWVWRRIWDADAVWTDSGLTYTEIEGSKE